jgi:hypothetical protein
MSYRMLTLTAAILQLTAANASAQTAIKLFDARPFTPSGPITDPTLAKPFAHADVTLICPQTPTATLSSTPDGTGKLLVDNWIQVNGDNVCTGLIDCGFTVPHTCAPSCFARFYLATDSYGPVPPIDIDDYVAPGFISLSFDLMDWGYALASSDVWLVTDCRLPSEGKQVICHKPGTPAEHTLRVAVAAVPAHLAHGDTLGPCEQPPHSSTSSAPRSRIPLE